MFHFLFFILLYITAIAIVTIQQWRQAEQTSSTGAIGGNKSITTGHVENKTKQLSTNHSYNCLCHFKKQRIAFFLFACFFTLIFRSQTVLTILRVKGKELSGFGSLPDDDSEWGGSNVLIKLLFSHSNFFTIASSSPLCSSPLLSLRGRSRQESVLIRSVKVPGDNRPAVDICKCVLALLGSWALGVSRCSNWQKHAQKGVNRKQIKMLQRSQGWHHSFFSSSFLKALVMFRLLQQSGGRRLLNKKKVASLSRMSLWFSAQGDFTLAFRNFSFWFFFPFLFIAHEILVKTFLPVFQSFSLWIAGVGAVGVPFLSHLQIYDSCDFH